MSRYHFASLLGVTLKCNLVNTAYQTRIKPAAYHLNCSRKKSLSVLSSSLVHVFTQLRKVSGIAFKSVVTSQSVTGFLPALFKKELVPRTVPAGWSAHPNALLENLNIQQYKLKCVYCPVLQLFCIWMKNYFIMKAVLKLSLSFCSIGCHFVFWAKYISLCSPKMGSSSGLCYCLWNCDTQAAQVFHILISISVGECAICVGT